MSDFKIVDVDDVVRRLTPLAESDDDIANAVFLLARYSRAMKENAQLSTRLRDCEIALSSDRNATEEDAALGAWMSAALEDPNVCEEMKQDIRNWFDSLWTEADPLQEKVSHNHKG